MMGSSQAGDQENGHSGSSGQWDAAECSPLHTGQNGGEKDDDEHLQNVADEESTLSPASRKIIEKCAFTIPPPFQKKESRAFTSMIARPPSAELDTAGFNFARPILPPANFSGRSRATPSSVAPSLARGIGAENKSKNAVQTASGNPRERSQYVINSFLPLFRNGLIDILSQV